MRTRRNPTGPHARRDVGGRFIVRTGAATVGAARNPQSARMPRRRYCSTDLDACRPRQPPRAIDGVPVKHRISRSRTPGRFRPSCSASSRIGSPANVARLTFAPLGAALLLGREGLPHELHRVRKLRGYDLDMACREAPGPWRVGGRDDAGIHNQARDHPGVVGKVGDEPTHRSPESLRREGWARSVAAVAPRQVQRDAVGLSIGLRK